MYRPLLICETDARSLTPQINTIKFSDSFTLSTFFLFHYQLNQLKHEIGLAKLFSDDSRVAHGIVQTVDETWKDFFFCQIHNMCQVE